METVFSQLGDILWGNQVLLSAAKPVFVSYGFDVRSVRVRVHWPKHVATPHSVINIILELCLTDFTVVIIIVTITQRDGSH
jgi:hypothetical protein